MDNNLDMMLIEIGRSIEWPEPSATFSQRVMARIEAAPTPARPAFRRAAPALVAGAALVAAVVTFSPTTRDAVADFIGIGGVHIKTVPKEDHLPSVTPGAPLDLGRAATLEEARAAVAYPVLVPQLLGTPDRVYLEKIAPADMVSLVYAGVDAARGEIEFLVTQFEGQLVRDGDLVKKMMISGTIVERVEVNGVEGYWLSGEPHTFYYRDGDFIRDESVRLVENVLLWVQDGVTIRIETGRSLEDALEIAASLR